MCCNGIKIPDLDPLDYLTGTEYLLVAYKDGDYKVPLNQLLQLLPSDIQPSTPDQNILELFNEFKNDLTDSLKEFKSSITSELEQFKTSVNSQIQSCHDTCQATQTELTNKVNSLTNQFNELKQYVDDTFDSLTSLPGDSTGGITQEELNSYLRNILIQIQSFSSTLTSTDTRLTAEIEQLKTQLEELSERVETNNNMLQNSIQDEVEKRTQDITEVKEALEAAKQALQDQIDELGVAEVNALKNQLNELSSKLDSHINNKQNPHEVTKEQVGLGNVDNTSDEQTSGSTNDAIQQAVDKAMEELREEVDGMKQELQDRLDETVGGSNDSKTKLEQLTSRVDGHDTSIAGLQTDVTGLKNSVTTLQSDFAELNSKVDQYDKRIGTLESDMNKLEAKVDSMDAKVTAYDTKIDKVQTDLDAHIQRRDNPHQVTRDQVGLGQTESVQFASLYAPSGFFKQSK